ncbi:MAG: hypothetical protein EA340_07100 [Nitriliruptor sp.]|nr:MAG: hypothetical protein EA340_07100 [Nitriliruptor sp.]
MRTWLGPVRSPRVAEAAASDTPTAVPGRRWAALSRRLDPVHPVLLGVGAAVQVVAIALAAPGLAVAGLAVGSLADLAAGDGSGTWAGRLRRAGLGVVPRTSLRLAWLLAALAVTGLTAAQALAFGAGVAAIVLGARVVQVSLARVVDRQPPTGVRHLGAGLDLAGFHPRVAWWRLILITLLAALELPLALGAWLLVVGPVAVGWALVLMAVLVPVAAALAAAVWSQRFLASDRVPRYREALSSELAALDTEVIVYFTGDADATYQLDQWLPVFDQLDPLPLLVLREATHLKQMRPSRLPVLLARRHADVEQVLNADPAVALYVGNAGRNIHLWRYGHIRHVFLNHGDSDKVSSANPVVKVYDELYVAGQVAVDRYAAAGVDLPAERFTIVGRPQLDRLLTDRQRHGDGPPTLLYAPTWEGYFAAADYSSVAPMGVELVRHVLTHHPEIRLVFKPHPLSGFVRKDAARATTEITRMLRAAGAPHVVAVDHPELDLLAWFDRSDVLLADVSAVVTDFLQTDKPYLVTNPRGLERVTFDQRFPSHRAAYVVDPDLDELSHHLDAAFGDDPLAEQRAEMKRAVLGEHPDGPLATFEAALAASVARSRADAVRISNTFAYDERAEEST